MQVNKIDNTNFGALKIDRGLRAELKNKPAEFLSVIDKLGEKIADVVRYNVVFDEEKGFATPTIRSVADRISPDYFLSLRSEESNLGRYFEIPFGVLGDTVSGFFPKEPYAFKKLYGKDAAKKYKEFKALDIYNQAAEYSRMLEQIELRRMIQDAKESSEKRVNELIQKTKQKQHEISVDELLNKYENNVVAEAKIEKAENDGFWSAIKKFFK